jgi:23S rRNA (uracil1939-C5)-methyltransferase
MEFQVEKWIHGGAGLGRWEERVVMLPYVLPGETVRARVVREHAGFLEARPLEIVEPSPQRIQPTCPYFGTCGGCSYQHAAYEFQLELKAAILAETVRRVGKLEPPSQIRVISGPAWEYRNRVRIRVAGRALGFRETGSHRLCAIERCPVAAPAINEALAAVSEMQRDRRFPDFVRGLELFSNETEVLLSVVETQPEHRRVARRFFEWAAEKIPGAADQTLDYQAAGEVFRVSRAAFFQVNRFLVDALVSCALEDALGETAVDLYAGTGLFALPLARRFTKVTAVESFHVAVSDLEFSAARAGLRVEAVCAGAEPYLDSLQRAPDLVLADPPRAGLGKFIVTHLLRLKPGRLILVSCDPATLARDLAQLLGGGYQLNELAMIDLFPQTPHLESVARLSLG